MDSIQRVPAVHVVDAAPLDSRVVWRRARALVQVNEGKPVRPALLLAPLAGERGERLAGGETCLGRQVAEIELQHAIHLRGAALPAKLTAAGVPLAPCRTGSPAAPAPGLPSQVIFSVLLGDPPRFSEAFWAF